MPGAEVYKVQLSSTYMNNIKTFSKIGNNFHHFYATLASPPITATLLFFGISLQTSHIDSRRSSHPRNRTQCTFSWMAVPPFPPNPCGAWPPILSLEEIIYVAMSEARSQDGYKPRPGLNCTHSCKHYDPLLIPLFIPTANMFSVKPLTFNEESVTNGTV